MPLPRAPYPAPFSPTHTTIASTTSSRRDPLWRSTPPAAHDKGSAFNRLFEPRELPMYKDKPEAQALSARRRPYWRRRRVVALMMILCAGALWVWSGGGSSDFDAGGRLRSASGSIRSAGGKLSSAGGRIGNSLSNSGSKISAEYRRRMEPQKVVNDKEAKTVVTTPTGLRDLVQSASQRRAGNAPDWSARRECVREAFKLSWDAYVRDAWGT